MSTFKIQKNGAHQRVSVSHLSNAQNTLLETFAFGICYLRTRFLELSDPYKPLTTAGRFTHYIASPYFTWFGQNDRIVTTPSAGRVGIQRADGKIESVVNGGSHNYAGFYTLSEDDDELQRKALEGLSVADEKSVPILHSTMLTAISKFFHAGCCFSTSTGYGANILGIPGVAGEGWLTIVDEKSHNSIFTGAFAAHTSGIKKFKHNDMQSLEVILETEKTKHQNILVVVEGLYSMDGTMPPLDKLYRLKKHFGFILYADEAHSFGAIGRTGRGCLECWNDLHPENPLPVDVIDVRSAVLSKAVGGLGGFVCGSSRFSGSLNRRASQLQKRTDSLSTSTMIQTISFLSQPLRLQQNLKRLLSISLYTHSELSRLGVRIYGDSYVPMLPVHAGRPSKASELSHNLRKHGLVASPVGPPAVDWWGSRVRVTLSASYSDEDVVQLVEAVLMSTSGEKLEKKNYFNIREQKENEMALNKEREASHRYLEDLVQQQICQQKSSISCPLGILTAGHNSRKNYGIGSGSARWILGTFQPHLEVEELVSQLLQQPSAMIYSDSDLGLMSTVAGLCRPIIGYKKHCFMVPHNVCSAVEEGLCVSSKNSGTRTIRYSNIESLVATFEDVTRAKDTYITLYLDTLIDGTPINFEDLTFRLSSTKVENHLTILLNQAEHTNGHSVNSSVFSDTVSASDCFHSLSARVLFSGSFFHAFGLPGGYLTGDPTIIEELRYSSRCYMFTTSPQPFVTSMIAENLKCLLDSAKVDPNRPYFQTRERLSHGSKPLKIVDGFQKGS